MGIKLSLLIRATSGGVTNIEAYLVVPSNREGDSEAAVRGEGSTSFAELKKEGIFH
jgi:hypothetical protein